jgi:hypothetical protein
MMWHLHCINKSGAFSKAKENKVNEKLDKVMRWHSHEVIEPIKA